MYLKVGLENPPKRMETRGKRWVHKKYRKKAGMRKLTNTIPLQNDGDLLFALQCNALVSLVHYVVCVTKQTRDASASHWRPERRPLLFRS